MKRLKIVFIIFSILCLLAAISGVGSVHMFANTSGSGVMTTSLNGLGRLVALVMALLFAAMSYLIHTHLPIGWKIGWLALGAGYISFMIGGISAMLENDPNLTFADFWLPSGLVVIGGAAVTWYWGRIWYRQKAYFI
jgi:hypothetical protein